MNKNKIFSLSAVILLIISCSEKPQLSNQDVQNKFNDEYLLEWNEDSTYVLGIKKVGKVYSTFLSPLQYFVFNIENDSVTFKETVTAEV